MMWGLRSHYLNFVHTVPGGAGYATVDIDSRGATFFSNSPTNGYWFRRFMQRCHRWIGDVWIPDRVLMIDELLHSMVLLDEDWDTYAKDPEGQLQTALTRFCLTVRYSAALWGEEIPRLNLRAMRKHWEDAIFIPESPHVPLASSEDSRTLRERRSSSSRWCSRQNLGSTIGTNGLTAGES
jgi:hypothetical protein